MLKEAVPIQVFSNLDLMIPGSLPSSFKGIDVVWKLHKCVLWQVLSKLPMLFDVAFQPDFINLALIILGER